MVYYDLDHLKALANTQILVYNIKGLKFMVWPLDFFQENGQFCTPDLEPPHMDEDGTSEDFEYDLH